MQKLNSCRHMLATITVALMTSLAAENGICSVHCQTGIESGRIGGALKRLASPDEGKRKAAFAEIVEIGPAAIPPLIRLLQELETPEIPCEDAQGKTGRAASGDETLFDPSVPGESKNPPCKKADEQLRLMNRVRSDAMGLLGRLRAVDAVPLLIDITRYEESRSLHGYSGPEILILIEIGRPAVPKLLNILMDVESERISTAGMPPRYSSSEIFRIESRIVMVLGEIGDVTALPALNQLRNSNADKVLAPSIEEAAAKIIEKNK